MFCGIECSYSKFTLVLNVWMSNQTIFICFVWEQLISGSQINWERHSQSINIIISVWSNSGRKWLKKITLFCRSFWKGLALETPSIWSEHSINYVKCGAQKSWKKQWTHNKVSYSIHNSKKVCKSLKACQFFYYRSNESGQKVQLDDRTTNENEMNREQEANRFLNVQNAQKRFL